MFKFFMAIVVVISIFVLIWIGQQTASIIPLQLDTEDIATATTTTGLALLDINAPRGIIHAMVASTSEMRQLGLSGTRSLPKDSGMLFIFPETDFHGFWMKDMNYPLDIIWIDPRNTVTSISTNISPQTFPKVFYPNEKIKFVLELNTGGAHDYGIATGTKLVF